MGKISAESLEKKLKTINRGAYWFGIIGRLAIFLGAVGVFFGLFVIISHAIQPCRPYFMAGRDFSFLITSLLYLASGWLFLLGRDAFEAIAYLIKESEDVV